MKKIFFFLLLIAVTGSTAIAQKGHLIIHGGGEMPDDIQQRITLYCGGVKHACMLIIPYANLKNAKGLDSTVKRYRKLGCANVDWVNCQPEEIDFPENLAKLEGVNVIYFSGGSQRDLVKALHGTQFLARIRQLNENGATIFGTSAGAAIMSRVMQAGGTPRKTPKGKSHDTYGVIAEDHVNLEEGFGFVPELIIDQHFIVRKRLHRLFSALLDRPDMLGVGIDEPTAIDVAPDGTFEVVGKSFVMVMEPKYQRGEIPRFNVLLLKKGDTYKYR